MANIHSANEYLSVLISWDQTNINYVTDEDACGKMWPVVCDKNKINVQCSPVIAILFGGPYMMLYEGSCQMLYMMSL